MNSQCSESKSTARRPRILILAGILLFLSLFRVGNPVCGSKTGNIVHDAIVVQQEGASPDMKRRLGDGCYHIYLDVGANIGVHTRFLFEPDLYPKAEVARGLFDEEFGHDRDNRDFCVFAFEPNPIHATHHHDMEEVYRALGWRYTFINAGVSDREGNLTFYKKLSNHEARHNDWGFSMVKRNDKAIPIQVPILDLAEWIMEHVAHRALPNIVYGKNYTKPKVIMKMDIEGAEYVVLPRLLFSGIMCNIIDLGFGELHPRIARLIERGPTDPEAGRGEIKITNAKEVKHWYLWLISKAYNSQALKSCPGRWRLLDDEAYVADTTPLPNISSLQLN